MASTTPSDFFTVATFGTLLGSVTVTTFVTNGLFKAFGWKAKWLGLVVSFLVMLAALFLCDKITDPKADVVGFFNSFLVYISAAGVTEAAAGDHRGGADGKTPLFRSWFR
jgi:hypothetical protein